MKKKSSSTTEHIQTEFIGNETPAEPAQPPKNITVILRDAIEVRDYPYPRRNAAVDKISTKAFPGVRIAKDFIQFVHNEITYLIPISQVKAIQLG